MGQKKHKHARRTVAFYKLHHGFKEPFKVRRKCGQRRRRGAAAAAADTYAPPALRSSSSSRTTQPPIPPPKRQNNNTQILVDGNFLHATLGAKCV